VPWRFHAQDAEAAAVVVKGDALNQPGDFLVRRSAFRDSSIHAWGSFPHGRCGICRAVIPHGPEAYNPLQDKGVYRMNSSSRQGSAAALLAAVND